MQSAGAPSHYEPSAEGQSPASISLSTGSPLPPAGCHEIAPVEIYKPPCGAMQVAPQGGFIVRMGMLFRGGKAKRRRLRRKKGSQPRLAALGSPFQGKGLAWTFPPSRGRGENAAIPILSFRAKARNLFRSRSGKGCEDSGEREAPCSPRIGRTVFHADSITKENGNGKRKRSLDCARDDETRERLFPFLFNLLRKPTPPRCARQPLPREGARVDTPSFLWRRLRCEDGSIPDIKPSF